MKSIEAMYDMDVSELKEVVRELGLAITPTQLDGTYKTGGLQNLGKADIVQVLGFKPNVVDDPDKVVNSWAFLVDGKPCAIWDYKGSHQVGMWSVYDPKNVLRTLFADKNFQAGW